MRLYNLLIFTDRHSVGKVHSEHTEVFDPRKFR